MSRTTDQPSASPQSLPKLSFWQIWNMSFGFLGIQFGFALQNANTSRIFETLGADTKNLAFYWLAAPLTGLIIQPIIGYFSDRTWHPRWGRRRPYFAIGAVLATGALILMPNSPTLWVAVGTLWIMDASINVSMEPFRAFVGDMLPLEQRTSGYAMQSFFIGVGAVVASALPWIFTNVIGLNDEAGAGEISQAVKWSFYLGAFAFLGAVMWTVFTTKEYPPREEHQETRKEGIADPKYTPKVYLGIGLALILVAIAYTSWIITIQAEQVLLILAGMIAAFGVCYAVAASMMLSGKANNGFVESVVDFQNMPKTMIQLAFVQFFTWFALFAMWIYATSGVTSHIYDMKLDRATLTTIAEAFGREGSHVKDENQHNDIKEGIAEFQSEMGEADQVVINVNFAKTLITQAEALGLQDQELGALKKVREQYNKGADWVGLLFAVYSLFAALAAIVLPAMAHALSRKVTHLIMLSAGGAGLISFYYITDPSYLMISMVGVGMAWASILSVPYAMLSSSLPAEKMGYYMGVFNFFIVIPQIVASAILGFLITNLFAGEFIYALVVGGASMILAGLLSLMVTDE